MWAHNRGRADGSLRQNNLAAEPEEPLRIEIVDQSCRIRWHGCRMPEDSKPALRRRGLPSSEPINGLIPKSFSLSVVVPRQRGRDIPDDTETLPTRPRTARARCLSTPRIYATQPTPTEGWREGCLASFSCPRRREVNITRWLWLCAGPRAGPSAGNPAVRRHSGSGRGGWAGS